jgi:hypothetical protein
MVPVRAGTIPVSRYKTQSRFNLFLGKTALMFGNKHVVIHSYMNLLSRLHIIYITYPQLFKRTNGFWSASCFHFCLGKKYCNTGVITALSNSVVWSECSLCYYIYSDPLFTIHSSLRQLKSQIVLFKRLINNYWI